MEVVTFAADLPAPWEHPLRARKVGKVLNLMPGLIGIHPDPRGMILVFATEAHAEKGRDALIRLKVPVAKHLMRGTLDSAMQTLNIKEPVDGWSEEEKAEIERRRKEREAKMDGGGVSGVSADGEGTDRGGA